MYYRGLAVKSLNMFIRVCSSNVGPGVRMCCGCRGSVLPVSSLSALLLSVARSCRGWTLGPSRASKQGFTKFCEDFTIIEKASTRVFSWLKVPTSASVIRDKLVFQFYVYLPRGGNICSLKCESTSRHFQPGEGPSSGLLHDYEPFV